MLFYIRYIVYMYAVYTQCLYNTILYSIHPHAVYIGNTGALLA